MPLGLTTSLFLAGFALVVLGCTTPEPQTRTTHTENTSTTQVRSSRAALPAPPALKIDSPRDIAPLLTRIIERAKVPGAAAVVLHGNRVVAQGAAGVRKKGSTAQITLKDQFEICSCAKAMTATLTAIMIEKGVLRWDSTPGELFGDVVQHLHPAWENVTVRDLLAHRAGLTDKHFIRLLTSVLIGRNVGEQRRMIATRFLSHPPDFPPKTKSVYASADYLVVAAALEKLTGRSWEELILEHLFTPLGMSTAGFGPPGTLGKVDQPWGHGARRLFYLPLPGASDIPIDPGSKSADYPMAAAPAGLVHLSVLDWAKFVAWRLCSDPANPHQKETLLSSDTLERMHEAEPSDFYMFPSDRKPIKNTQYASGWFTGTRPWARGSRMSDSGRVIYHQGDNGRWNCVVWVAPEIDFAVLVAFNRAGTWGACDQVAAALIHEFASIQYPIEADTSASSPATEADTVTAPAANPL